MVGKSVIGYFGELHPSVAANFSLKSKAAIFEFFIDNLPLQLIMETDRDGNFTANDLQPVKRDFSFVMGENEEVGNFIRDIYDVDSLISRVTLFDIYPYQDGKKSVAIAVEIQPVQRTLGKDEIDKICNKIVDFTSKKYGGILRES